MINQTNKTYAVENIPEIMGVINATPDSFYAKSIVNNLDTALCAAEKMAADGASIIDVGGEATNPFIDNVTDNRISAAEEIDRVTKIIEAIAARIDTKVSIDTSKPEVMVAAVQAGANMINDQRALTLEGAMKTAIKLKIPVCLMHMGFSKGKILNRSPQLITDKVKTYLQQRIDQCLENGIRAENIIIDPGFGQGCYGKTTKENLYMLNNLEQFCQLKYPVMVGLSRKSIIGDVLGVNTGDRLTGSISLAVIAAIKGARIIRTHDVAETFQAVKMATAVMQEP